jgi:hypothetical protein
MVAIAPPEIQKDRSLGPKREKTGKKKGKKKGDRNEKEKSQKRGKEARCRSFHFPFLLTWMDWRGTRLRHHV